MNVLIIDDQPDVVEGILSGIDWMALEVRNTFYAYDILQAKAIIQAHSVNIMLCDIEMPLGSGLELYEWVAEHYPEIKCIFLTSHEDFSYAQKALHLGGFDYLIQPAPYNIIETALRKAIMQIRKEQRQKLYSVYGSYISEHEMDLLDLLLREYLSVSAPHNNLLNYLQTISVPVDPEAPCFLVTLDILNKKQEHPQLDLSLLRYIIHNAFSELMEPFTQKLLFCHLRDSLFAAILYEIPENNYQKLSDCLLTFIHAARQYMHFETACYAVYSENFYLLPGYMQKLLKESSANVAKYSGIFIPDIRNEFSSASYESPDFSHWATMLASGYFDSVRTKMHQYLNRQKDKGTVNQKMLSLFQQDFLQMFYHILEENHIHAHGIFEEEYDIHALQTSCTSLERMHELLDFSIDYLKNLYSGEDLSSTQIDKAIDFIRKNIHQNISRTEIANSIYMNPDYLSRLFKKVKGISLTDYILQEKLKIAVSLLSSTKLSVSVIATNIGYTNFSYFTQVFKKVYGMSPSEYRQQKENASSAP